MADGGFSKYQINAQGQLVIQALKSPNYVHGVDGWTINKDGTVEFNNGVFRGQIINGGLLVYDGSPAAGKLVAALSPVADTDPYGNHYGVGLTFPPTDGSFNFSSIQMGLISAIETLRIAGPPGVGTPFIDINNLGKITLDSSKVLIHTGPNQNLDIDSTGYQFSGGIKGLYHHEEWSQPVLSLTNNTVMQIGVGSTRTILQSDYGSGWDNGLAQWTCPTDSDWTIEYALSVNAFGANGRFLMDISTGALSTGTILRRKNYGILSGLGPDDVLTFNGFLAAGTTLYFNALQGSGANLNTIATRNARLTFHRHL